MEIEIIENLNPWKETDIIDLTNLVDENEQNSGEQDKPNNNKNMLFLTRNTRKI